MRLLAASALVVALGALGPADEKKPDPAADLKAMVGRWKLEKAEVGGKDMKAALKDMKFEITDGGKYHVEVGKEAEDGTFTVDPSKSPREMEIKTTTGPNKGRTIPAIYTLDGDTLMVCYELGGGKRPEKFESKPDTKQYLAVYTREKK